MNTPGPLKCFPAPSHANFDVENTLDGIACTPQGPWLTGTNPDVNQGLITGPNFGMQGLQQEANFAEFNFGGVGIGSHFAEFNFGVDPGSDLGGVDIGSNFAEFNSSGAGIEFNTPLGMLQNANPAGVSLDHNSIKGLPQRVNFLEPSLDFDRSLGLLQNPGVIETQPFDFESQLFAQPFVSGTKPFVIETQPSAFETAPDSGEIDPEFAQRTEAVGCQIIGGERKLRLFFEEGIYGCQPPDEFYFNPNEFQCNTPVLVCCECGMLNVKNTMPNALEVCVRTEFSNLDAYGILDPNSNKTCDHIVCDNCSEIWWYWWCVDQACDKPNRDWSDCCVWCGRERDPTTPGTNGPAPPLNSCLNRVRPSTPREIISTDLAQTFDSLFDASTKELSNNTGAYLRSSLMKVYAPSLANPPSSANIPNKSIKINSPTTKTNTPGKKIVIKFKRNVMDAARPSPNLGNENCNIQSQTKPSNSWEISTTQDLNAPRGRIEYQDSTTPREPSATMASSPELKGHAARYPTAVGKEPVKCPKIKLKLSTGKRKRKATENLEESTESGCPQSGKRVSQESASKRKCRRPLKEVVAANAIRQRAIADHLSTLLKNKTDNHPQVGGKTVLPPPEPRKSRHHL